MALKHGLLGLLHYGPMTGYDLSKAFHHSLNHFWRAQTSQIYKELNRMEKEGWLSSQLELQTDKPNRRVYHLTPEGRRQFAQWLAQPPDTDEVLVIKSQFLMRTFFLGERDPAANIQFFETFRQICLAAVQQVEGAQQSIAEYSGKFQSGANPLYWQMTRTFGLEYYRFCAAWAERCIETLREV